MFRMLYWLLAIIIAVTLAVLEQDALFAAGFGVGGRNVTQGRDQVSFTLYLLPGTSHQRQIYQESAMTEQAAHALWRDFKIATFVVLSVFHLMFMYIFWRIAFATPSGEPESLDS